MNLKLALEIIIIIFEKTQQKGEPMSKLIEIIDKLDGKYV